MRSIDTYAEEIKEKVAERLGDGFRVTVDKIAKNNGVTLTGLTIHKDGERISPTIHLDGFYESDDGNAVDEILKLCDTLSPDPAGLDRIHEWEEVRERVCFKLINTEKNRRRLEEMPHREFLDLSAVYFISMNVRGQEASASVTDRLASIWGVTEQELWDAAFVNTQKRYPARIRGISEMISEIVGEPGGDDAVEEAPMLVASNDKSINGAGVIFYDDVLTRLADTLGDAIYIFPSSVHEMIAIADNGTMDVKDLAEMVREINRTIVEDEEVLSDSVYRYERGGEITIVEVD